LTHLAEKHVVKFQLKSWMALKNRTTTNRYEAQLVINWREALNDGNMLVST